MYKRQVLLSAVLLGGDSLVYTLNVKYYSMFALAALAAVKLLLCILLAGTALMIRGGFWLSLERRTRALGQLASVGATPAQLRASVLLEAALLGVVAIPLGMLFAMLGLQVGFWAMNQTPGIQTITAGQGDVYKRQGVACEMDTIMDIARRHGLKVVEDAAQGVMSTYKGKALGTIGDFGLSLIHI